MDFKATPSLNGAAIGPLGNTLPAAPGTASAGSSTTASRSDHVHPDSGGTIQYASLCKYGLV